LDATGDWWLEKDRKQTKPPGDTHALCWTFLETGDSILELFFFCFLLGIFFWGII
jgi:hypothetical protein